MHTIHNADLNKIMLIQFLPQHSAAEKGSTIQETILRAVQEQPRTGSLQVMTEL